VIYKSVNGQGVPVQNSLAPKFHPFEGVQNFATKMMHSQSTGILLKALVTIKEKTCLKIRRKLR
jgi:hypothetical protein